MFSPWPTCWLVQFIISSPSDGKVYGFDWFTITTKLTTLSFKTAVDLTYEGMIWQAVTALPAENVPELHLSHAEAAKKDPCY